MYQLKQSRFNDPEQTSGQHTNGPANIFVREDEGSPWYVVTMATKSVHVVRSVIEQVGFGKFVEKYCEKATAQREGE